MFAGARGTTCAPPHRSEGSSVIDYTDRVVLVTGAAGGIGSATARTVVSLGGGVVIHDVSLDGRLRDLHDELGDNAHAVAADLDDASSVAELWRAARDWRGRIDVLVNNAGIYEPAAVDDPLQMWNASWQRMLAICLFAPATLCREAVK